MVVDGFRWLCMLVVVVDGCGWFWMVVDGCGRSWMVLDGRGWLRLFWMVVDGCVWLWMVVCVVAKGRDNKELFIAWLGAVVLTVNTKRSGKMKFAVYRSRNIQYICMYAGQFGPVWRLVHCCNNRILYTEKPRKMVQLYIQ